LFAIFPYSLLLPTYGDDATIPVEEVIRLRVPTEIPRQQISIPEVEDGAVFNTATAAKALGVTRQAVGLAIKEGRLKATPVGGVQKVIFGRDLKQYVPAIEPRFRSMRTWVPQMRLYPSGRVDLNYWALFKLGNPRRIWVEFGDGALALRPETPPGDGAQPTGKPYLIDSQGRFSSLVAAKHLGATSPMRLVGREEEGALIFELPEQSGGKE
jgi:hypothetical protein